MEIMDTNNHRVVWLLAYIYLYFWLDCLCSIHESIRKKVRFRHLKFLVYIKIIKVQNPSPNVHFVPPLFVYSVSLCLYNIPANLWAPDWVSNKPNGCLMLPSSPAIRAVSVVCKNLTDDSVDLWNTCNVKFWIIPMLYDMLEPLHISVNVNLCNRYHCVTGN
jgi:hypothetical protein